ncbi:hypothetical protein OU787_27285 [Kitasatospora sp. YST-16]|uniref:hypothetical protein n=2 Tax=unclassified Kitasatospora TaxID=2633591 RepID=UPI0022836595|nr:hypothetical protein [Kitasatospora sp. YST-16]WAL74886.1 hypothetical protein OU787_27285 [Kitasatospora sp. YST-16]WNW40942.1 hypothetical protein RKE32_27220 [Streptomyces sp. Li-HN-5-13]
MNRIARPRLTAIAVATALASAILAAAPAVHAEGTDLSDPAAVTLLADYSCGSVSGSDNVIAARLSPALTGSLNNYLTAYRVSCARAIINAVQSRGLSHRAAVIAVTTSIVETTLRNVPGGDLDSVGLFQQRDSWGSFDQRMDPTWSTNAFLNQMLKVSNWQTMPVGDVCQAVQISAYPTRYQAQAQDAEQIVDAVLADTTTGDEPVAGNWDAGNGSPAGNVGVFRPSTGQFHLRMDDGSLKILDWGQAGDIPVSANWDGAGPDNIGVFRPSTGQFHLRMDDGSLKILDWGQAGDLPVAGNWDAGNGAPAGNIGVFRPSTGQFHLRMDDGSLKILDWGQAGDIPVSGNWDGAGPDNIGVFRPSTGQFHLRMDDGSLKILDWGQAGDLPVSANFDGGNGAPAGNIGIWRPSTGQFHLRNDDGSLTVLDWGQPR